MVSYFLWFFFKGKIWLFFFLDPWRPWIFPWLCSEFFMGLMEQKIPGPMKSRLISNGRIQKGFLEELLWYRCIHGHLVYKSSSCSRQPRLCFEIKWNKYSTSSLVRGALCRCFFVFPPSSAAWVLIISSWDEAPQQTFLTVTLGLEISLF